MTEADRGQKGLPPRADAAFERLGLDRLPADIQEASRVLLAQILSAPTSIEGMKREDVIQTKLRFASMHYSGEFGKLLQELASAEEITTLASYRNPQET